MAVLRVISVTSGKGGVGKSHLAANLATVAAHRGLRSVAIDADVGLANLDVLFGVYPELHVGDLLDGEALDHVLLQTPAGPSLLPGARGEQALTHLTSLQQQTLVEAWRGISERFDVVIVDSAPGLQHDMLFFAGAAQQVVLVVTPEPTSLSDARAVASSLRQRTAVREIEVVVNEVRTERVAQSVFARLQGLLANEPLSLKYCGFVPEDHNVRRATAVRRPLVDLAPHSPASRAFERIGHALFDAPSVLHGGLQVGLERTLGEVAEAPGVSRDPDDAPRLA
jgi:flagellar biosynthesis protein FlhG